MDRERQIINGQSEQEGGRRDQEALALVKAKTRELLANLPELHGWEHTALVAHYAKLLALGEKRNIFNAEMAGWTHDWGWAFEKTDKEKRPHATLSGVVSKDFYWTLYEKERLNALEYGDIQRAVRRHSRAGETPRDTLKIVRDSDRLSRFDPVGFYHNTQGILIEEGLPFYVAGQPIIRATDAPVMERKDKKCVIDGLNFCLDWVKIAETASARKMFKQVRNTYDSFLQLFSRHTDLTDGQLWIAFLKKHADEFRKKKEDFEKTFVWSETEKDLEKWLKFYEENVDQKFYSEEKFQEFLEEYPKS